MGLRWGAAKGRCHNYRVAPCRDLRAIEVDFMLTGGGSSGIGQLKSGVSYEFESSWPVSVCHRGVSLDDGSVTIPTNELALKEVQANLTLKEGVSRGGVPKLVSL